MLTNDNRGPAEMSSWMSRRNINRTMLPNMYTPYDIEEAIRIYEEMLEALFNSKLAPGESFDTPVKISYDKEIFGTGLNSIVAMSMEYGRPDLLSEAYRRLMRGNVNLEDIRNKLTSIKHKDEDGDAAAVYYREHRARMRDVADRVAMEIADMFHSHDNRSRITFDQYREALSVYHDKNRLRELISLKWEKEYPNYLLTRGDVDEIREWLLEDEDMHDLVLRSAKYVSTDSVE